MTRIALNLSGIAAFGMLTVILLIALSGCSTVTDASHDYAGNVYPADCPASITSDPELLSRVTVTREHVSGTYGTTRGTLVTLDPALSGWLLEDTRRHEFCHVVHGLKGNPDWHAHYVSNIYRAPTCADLFHC